MFVKPNRLSIDVLPFFPAGLPDETIGSRISRYHILRGQLTAHSTYQQLFERGAFSLTGLVPPCLDKLAAKLPGSPKNNLLRLQNESTLLPLFQRFLGTQTSTTITANSNGILSVELPRRINGDSTLTHMCTQCLIEDEKNHGTPYLHRSHQIPGVTACWKHKTKLLDCCPACRCPFAQRNRLILSAWLGCACGYAIADQAKAVQESPAELEIEFANFAQVMLTDESIQLNSSQLISLYRSRAVEVGYGKNKFRLNRKKLFTDIEEFFGSSLLSKIDPAYRAGKLGGWFNVMSPALAVETPLNRHLIFSFFLFRDARLFLSRARAAAETSADNDELRIGQNKRAEVSDLYDGHGATKQSAKQLLNELVENAQRYDYDAQQLWNHHFGAMKRLVKLLPNACDLIDERLQAAVAKKKRQTAIALKAKAHDHQLDVQWSEEIVAISVQLYDENKRPIRVTRRRLIRAAKSFQKGTGWPSEARFPLAAAASKAHAESTWHFYARRMLWTLQSLHDADTCVRKIVRLAGLEVHKAKPVLQYFQDVARCGGASIKRIKAILDGHGIDVNWQGPCPERSFYRTGRAYQLLANRRDPTGGRNGDGI